MDENEQNQIRLERADLGIRINDLERRLARAEVLGEPIDRAAATKELASLRAKFKRRDEKLK